MMKFCANVTQTALKDLNLAQAGNYDHVLNLKYTCRALPSCQFSNRVLLYDFSETRKESGIPSKRRKRHSSSASQQCCTLQQHHY